MAVSIGSNAAGEPGGLLRAVQYAAVGGLAFQVVHLIEHVAQTAYWAAHPTEAPWLTPWATAGRDMLVVDGKVPTGNELLHLIGNVIFLAALVGMLHVARTVGRPATAYPHLGKALWLQGIHVAEHILLTATTLTLGKAMGFSTVFGFASGAWGSSYRVWFHCILNAIATYYALRAMREMHHDDLIVPGSFNPLGAHARK